MSVWPLAPMLLTPLLVVQFEFTLAPPYDTLHSETVGPSSNRCVLFSRCCSARETMTVHGLRIWDMGYGLRLRLRVQPRAR